MDKLKMHSPNLTHENIAKLRELFPGCVTEAKDKNGRIRYAVDFDQLRQELLDHIVEGPQERYRLDWPGKRSALMTANAPIAKTVLPCREERVPLAVGLDRGVIAALPSSATAFNWSNPMNWQNHIRTDPSVLAGKLVVKGTRLTVEFLLGLLDKGWIRVRVLENYLQLPMKPRELCLLSLPKRCG